MKEIWFSLALMIVIAVGAAFALEAMDWSAASTYTSQKGNVRI